MERVKVDRIVCTGCEACIDSCPTDVLRLDTADGKPHVAYPEDCQLCFLCEIDCPVGAISLSLTARPGDVRS